MIRPFTAICMLLAAGSGLYLYQQKHKSQVLERQIEDTVKKTIAAQRRVLFLTAEWDLLNDPERLAKLSEQFLKLRTMHPAQFAAIDDLANRLPAVRAIPAAPDHSTEEPGASDTGADPVAEAPLPIPPALVPPPPAPVIARPATTPAAPSANGAAPVTHAATAVAPVPRAAPVTPSPFAAPSAAPASPVVAARPVAPAPRPQGVASPTVPSQPQAPAVGMSALGMARGSSAAPPPVPISATRDFNPIGGN